MNARVFLCVCVCACGSIKEKLVSDCGCLLYGIGVFRFINNKSSFYSWCFIFLLRWSFFTFPYLALLIGWHAFTFGKRGVYVSWVFFFQFSAFLFFVGFFLFGCQSFFIYADKRVWKNIYSFQTFLGGSTEKLFKRQCFGLDSVWQF